MPSRQRIACVSAPRSVRMGGSRRKEGRTGSRMSGGCRVLHGCLRKDSGGFLYACVSGSRVRKQLDSMSRKSQRNSGRGIDNDVPRPRGLIRIAKRGQDGRARSQYPLQAISRQEDLTPPLPFNARQRSRPLCATPSAGQRSRVSS